MVSSSSCQEGVMKLDALTVSPAAASDLERARRVRHRHADLIARPHPTRSVEGRPIDGALWPAVLRAVESRVGHYSFFIWFAATRLADDDGTVLTVLVEDASVARWLKAQYADVLVEAVIACGYTGRSIVFATETPEIP
jgi:hypothetical protein